MMKKYIAILFTALALTTSCDDWLDVRGENIQKEKNQFESYHGFRDALTGCYMEMANTDAYGQRLTMTNLEDLANLWYIKDIDEDSDPTRYYLYHHQYDKDNVRPAIKAIYGKLFNVISSANVLLKNLEKRGENIGNETKRAVITGEAYAIRAYCQFDVLRLFGQIPQGATKQVSLPYSYTTSIDEMPQYYAFADYVSNLKKDILKAEASLKDNDPIFSQTYSQLNYATDAEDDYMCFRQSRLNYWAVRALHARMALYLGETQEAHDIAMEIINAKGADGEPLMALSGASDLTKGYNALPSECLFYLSKYDINSYANKVLIGGLTIQAREEESYISNQMLSDLYASVPGSTASHNRYLNWWNRQTKNPLGQVCPSIKKYWYDESKAENGYLTTKYQIIPMLRMSEVYLIAMETSKSLEEIRSLYATYMAACQYTLYQPFETVAAAHEEMINEYRRELFAEGQMFYVYKRTAAKKMKWNDDDVMTEDSYILPLPSTEYDSNK